ncbi:MAG: RNA polymerase sigma factor [Candidatus Kapabacteria bacterium]|nr:RNA polymerase sigma factor [Candidatus Kapabacteria bacterium]
MEYENSLLKEFVENGNRKSFEELFKMTKPWLYRLIYTIVTDRDNTDEILQQTWVKVLDTAYRIDFNQGSINNYLYTIAKNNSFKFQNRNKQAIALKEKFKSKEATIVINDNSPHSDAELSESNLLLKEAIQKLDKKYQDIILLHYFSELEVNEISKMLNIPEGTIKTRLVRGRQQLKEILIKSDYLAYLGIQIVFGLIFSTHLLTQSN